MERPKISEFRKRAMRDPVFAEHAEDQQARSKIGNLIRRSREAGGRTQQWLSEASGVDQADISKIECGNRMPAIETLTRLAHALDMHIKVEMTPSGKSAAEAKPVAGVGEGLFEVI